MIRVLAISLLAILAGCSPSVPSAQLRDPSVAGVSVTVAVAVSASDALLREEKAKLKDISRAYENCKDVGNYAEMMKLARARRIELDVAIRQIHKMKLSPEEQERLLNPLRQERDWHLEVIQVASSMLSVSQSSSRN